MAISKKSSKFLRNSADLLLLDPMIPMEDIFGSKYNSDSVSFIRNASGRSKSREDYYNLYDHGDNVDEKLHSKINYDSTFGETKGDLGCSRIVTEKVFHELEKLLSSLLLFLGGLVIKTVGFQINAFIRLLTFPIWFMYCSFMFVVDPFRIVKWARDRTLGVCLGMWCCFCKSLTLPLRGQKSAMKLVIKLCWGFFWAAYVCFLLFGLLVLGFVIGGVTMRYIVEEPIQMKESLNFDYTKSSPIALVPVMSCPTTSCGLNCKESMELDNFVASPIIPPNRNLKLDVSLTLPESDYNQKLGVFQVRVDLLSRSGEVIASPSYPCMLQFKSQLIRYLETFFRSISLLAGYSSESQTLNIKMSGFTDDIEPISCLKVILEHRAEYRPGTGIPEIYAGSLALEAELPLVKRMIWNWRKTTFVWISMLSFMTELMVVLICCKLVVVPRAMAKGSSGKKTTGGNAVALLTDS